MFIACVAAYIGWRIWKFERFWAYFIPQFVLASALAVELARGGRVLERWLTVVIATFFSAGFAVSCFRMSFYTYPDGSTAPELIIPGIGFSLCAIALVVSEVILHLRQKEHAPSGHPATDVVDKLPKDCCHNTVLTSEDKPKLRHRTIRRTACGRWKAAEDLSRYWSTTSS